VTSTRGTDLYLSRIRLNGALMAPFVVMVTKNHNVFLIGLMAVGRQPSSAAIR